MKEQKIMITGSTLITILLILAFGLVGCGGNNQEMSVLDSAHLIHSIASTGKKLKLKFIPMEDIFGKYKDIMRRVPDLSKAYKILGYQPKISINEAVETIIEKRRWQIEKGKNTHETTFVQRKKNFNAPFHPPQHKHIKNQNVEVLL